MLAIEKFLETWNKRETDTSPLVNLNSRKYNSLNVVLSRSARDNNTIRINYINSKKRRKGEMKKFLQWITSQADRGEFSLTMAAQPVNRHYEESVPKEVLKETTEAFGFTVRFEYPDELGYEMERLAF